MQAIIAETAGAAVGSLTTLVGTAVERRRSERRMKHQAADLARQEEQRRVDTLLREVMRRLDQIEAS